MILGLQIIALVFALIMIYFAYLHYRKGDINRGEMLFWSISWIGAIFIITFPSIFGAFAQTIAISRAFDLAVVGGFILVIPLVYSAYVRTKRLERKFEELIRKESLRTIYHDKKRKITS